MISDTSRILQELEILTNVTLPEADSVKMKYKYEEIVSNYDITRKTPLSLENDFNDKLDLYLSAKKLEGLSQLTLNGYRMDLEKFGEFVNKPAVMITTPDVRAYLTSFETNKASTINKKLSVIKTFMAWMVDEEMLLKNVTNKIKPIRQPKRLPKSLTETELETLRDSCERPRERALVEVLYSTGCRVSELINMKVDDVNWSSGALSVIGKGDKERVVYLNDRAKYYLKIYLDYRKLEDDDCEFLFTTVRRPYRKMSPSTIQDELNRIGERGGLEGVHPHRLRHTMATLSMNKGIQLGDLQQLLGHSNPSTTLVYTEVSEDRKRNAHKRYVQ